MPTYVYKREDGTTFEIEQRITASALAHCPTTGQPVRRVPSAGAGLVFKGSGFYQTDYVRKSDSGKESEGAKPEGSKEAKPEAASDKAGASGESNAPAAPAIAGASTPGTPGST